MVSLFIEFSCLLISVCLTEKRLLEVINFCQQTGSWTDLNRFLGIFFRPETLMSSFPLESSTIDMPTNTSPKELLRSIELDRDKDHDELVCYLLFALLALTAWWCHRLNCQQLALKLSWWPVFVSGIVFQQTLHWHHRC